MSLASAIGAHFARRRQQAAQLRLAMMVEARRHNPNTVQYRARRAAALKHTRGQA